MNSIPSLGSLPPYSGLCSIGIWKNQSLNCSLSWHAWLTRFLLQIICTVLFSSFFTELIVCSSNLSFYAGDMELLSGKLNWFPTTSLTLHLPYIKPYLEGMLQNSLISLLLQSINTIPLWTTMECHNNYTPANGRSPFRLYATSLSYLYSSQRESYTLIR